MATPTQKLTERSARLLDEEVALAVRVRRCPAGSTHRSDHVSDQQPTRPLSPYPAAGFPIVPMVRGAKRSISDMFSADHDTECLVLAFTGAGERVLMGRERFRSLYPIGTIRRLPGRPPIRIDLGLLTNELIPEIRIDDECFIVNSVDFGALTRAVVKGELDEPELAEQLGPYYEQARAFAHYDPNTLRTMMPDKYDTDSSS